MDCLTLVITLGLSEISWEGGWWRRGEGIQSLWTPNQSLLWHCCPNQWSTALAAIPPYHCHYHCVWIWCDDVRILTGMTRINLHVAVICWRMTMVTRSWGSLSQCPDCLDVLGLTSILPVMKLSMRNPTSILDQSEILINIHRLIVAVKIDFFIVIWYWIIQLMTLCGF